MGSWRAHLSAVAAPAAEGSGSGAVGVAAAAAVVAAAAAAAAETETAAETVAVAETAAVVGTVVAKAVSAALGLKIDLHPSPSTVLGLRQELRGSLCVQMEPFMPVIGLVKTAPLPV